MYAIHMTHAEIFVNIEFGFNLITRPDSSSLELLLSSKDVKPFCVSAVLKTP